MGQTSSSAETNLDLPGNTPRCYYEVLEVESDASSDDIKKAYRRRALELHPDRNLEDVENKTRLFAELQSAFEVLSDPHNRAWYDSHRRSILSGNAEVAGGVPQAPRDVLTTEDISKFYESIKECLKDAGSTDDFYLRCQTFFGRLAEEENCTRASDGQETLEIPSFGSRESAFDHELKEFYAFWASFSTAETFAWTDIFRMQDAPDRRTRRMMERENQRKRDESIREFNAAVRTLASWIKRKDPRCAPPPLDDSQGNAQLRQLSAAQASRSRLENRARVEASAIPNWSISKSAEESEASEFEEVMQSLECVVCKKSFQSENQFASHARSKKHLKAVSTLKRRIQRENASLGIKMSVEGPVSSQEAFEPVHPGDNTTNKTKETEHHSLSKRRPSLHAISEKDRNPSEIDRELTPEQQEDISPPDATRKDAWFLIGFNDVCTGSDFSGGSDEDRCSERTRNDTGRKAKASEHEGSGQVPESKGRTKPKARRAKQTTSSVIKGPHSLQCIACKAEFPSRTKLFDHVREFGHAKPITEDKPAGRDRKRGK